MQKNTILAVDDEIHILELLKFNLEKEGYDVFCIETGEQALSYVSRDKPDLIILDIMLPGIDGIEVCKQIKSKKETALIPIIMLTAKSQEVDKILGLEIGADDYITKPFSVRELIARVKAVLRRFRAHERCQNPEIIKIGNISIDVSNYEVYKEGQNVQLTLKEFELLKILALNKNKVLTRDQLLNRIWGYDYYGETRTVDVHIRHLRKKIEDGDGNPKYIHTVRGVGYKFDYKDDSQ
ncbi:MAG: response regulator transcription factor [Clostridia bacterium]|nr:response regulator transcription factor [Clostridia bacterium]